MIRRILLFCLVFAALFGLLLLLFGKDDLLRATETEAAQDKTSEAPRVSQGALRVGQSGQAGGMAGSGTIAFEGAGEIAPLQAAVRIGDRVWQVPEFKLSWADSQPVGASRYRLLQARFIAFERLRPTSVDPRAREFVIVDAASMEVVIAQKPGGEVAIDEQHDVQLRDVVVRAPTSALGASLGPSSGAELVLEAARMTARVKGAILELETPPEDVVTIKTREVQGEADRSSQQPDTAKRRPELDYVLRGRGLSLELDEVIKQDDVVVSVGTSFVRLAHDVDLRGFERKSGAELFRVLGRGALELVPIDAQTLRLRIEDDVQFEATSQSTARRSMREPLRGRGDRLLAWLRRDSQEAQRDGRPESADKGRARVGEFSCSDIRLAGAAKLEYGGQSMDAASFDLALDPWHEPLRLVATGEPRVHLHDRTGKVLGTLMGQTRMFWDRPGLAIDTVLRALGAPLDDFTIAFGGVAPLLPRETLRVEGPAIYLPSDSFKNLSEARSDGGVLVTLVSHFGRLEPNMLVGRGDARIDGFLADGVPFRATGNRGFVVAHVPGSDEVRGALGPFDIDAQHDFVFESKDDRVTGRGSVLFHVVVDEVAASSSTKAKPSADSAKRAEVLLRAALREELRWESLRPGEKVSATGIKSLLAVHERSRPAALTATGLPLRLDIEGAVVTAALAERTGSTQWRLVRGEEAVRVSMPAKERVPAWDLDADEVLLSAVPGFVPSVRPGHALRVLARGSVELRSRDDLRRTSLRLRCRELERFPAPFRGLIVAATRDALGDAGLVLAPLLFGGEAGLIHARSDVQLEVEQFEVEQFEKGAEPGVVEATSTFAGASLWLDADGATRRFLLSGDEETAVVSAALHDRRRGIVRLEGRALRANDDGFELVAREDGGCTVDFVEEVDAARRLRLDSSGTVQLRDARLVVPGPVRARMVDERGVHHAGDLDLRAGGDLVIRLRDGYTKALAKNDGTTRMLPRVVERCDATGGVELRVATVVAEGASLRFTPDDAWIVLEDRYAAVSVFVDETMRIRATPELSFNLRTLAYRGTRVRVDNQDVASKAEAVSR